MRCSGLRHVRHAVDPRDAPLVARQPPVTGFNSPMAIPPSPTSPGRSTARRWWGRLAAVLGLVVGFALVSAAFATGPLRQDVPAAATGNDSVTTTDDTSLTPESANTDDVLPAHVPFEDRPVAAFLGDSISRGMTEPTSGVVGEYSWFYGLVDPATGVVQHGGTTAENGRSTAWMAGQVWTALNPKPDILIVHGGTNDVSGEITPPVVVDNLERIRLAAVSAGVPLAVCTVPPRADPLADARALAVNEAIRSWAASNDVIVLDTAAPLRDPFAGGWIPGYSTDGLHPTPAAALLMSRAAAETLRFIPQGV